MKTYIDRHFDREQLKKCDIAYYGTYYVVPIVNLAEDVRSEFIEEDEQTSVCLDYNTIYESNDYVTDYNHVEYAYSDENEWQSFVEDLMNYERYDHFLVLAYHSRWTGASGYKICDDYHDVFFRDYDVSMYANGSSGKGKYLMLTEYSHDVPTGHTTMIVGLTDREYARLDNATFEQVLAYGNKAIERVIEL